MDVVRALAAFATERGEGLFDDALHLGRVGAARARDLLGVVGRTHPGPPAEDEKVRKRVPSETVGAVHAACDLSRGEEPGCRRRLGVGVDADPAHDVVAGGSHLHGLGRYVHPGQLHELVVHRRQAPADDVGGQAGGDVEEHPAVRATAAGLHLAS